MCFLSSLLSSPLLSSPLLLLLVLLLVLLLLTTSLSQSSLSSSVFPSLSNSLSLILSHPLSHCFTLFPSLSNSYILHFSVSLPLLSLSTSYFLLPSSLLPLPFFPLFAPLSPMSCPMSHVPCLPSSSLRLSREFRLRDALLAWVRMDLCCQSDSASTDLSSNSNANRRLRKREHGKRAGADKENVWEVFTVKDLLLSLWQWVTSTHVLISNVNHKLVNVIMTFSRFWGVGKLLCEVGDDGEVVF